jgi:AraC family transcriptional regulator
MESIGHEVLGWLDPDATAERQIPRWLREAHDRVTGDPTGGHTLSSIARSVSIDRTHLAREYRRHFGFSVGEHLRRLRIDTAWQMLVKGCSIENAAVQAGFYDAAHLKRHLTAMTGWSVSEFRTQIRN